MNKLTDARSDKIFSFAKELEKKDNHEATIVALLGPYLEARPKDAAAWFSYGSALRILGRSNEAMQALSTALDLAPPKRKFSVSAQIAILAREYRSPAEAKAWFDRAANDPYCDVGWVWLLRGANLAVLGEWDEALSSYKKAMSLPEVDKDEALLNMAKIYRAKGDYREALRLASQALAVRASDEARSFINGLEGIQDAIDTMLGSRKRS